MFGEKLSHYVDLTRWWIGDEVEEVYATCAPNVIPYYEVHDNFHCTYRFKNGAVSHLTFMMAPAATFKGDPLQNAVSQQAGDGHALRYMIYGEKGAAETDVFPRTIKRWEFGENDYGQTSEWVQTETWSPEQRLRLLPQHPRSGAGHRPAGRGRRTAKNQPAGCAGNHTTVFCCRALRGGKRSHGPDRRT